MMSILRACVLDSVFRMYTIGYLISFVGFGVCALYALRKLMEEYYG